MNYFKGILIIITLGIFISNSVKGQKIITDTIFLSAGYGEYCEAIQVCETIIPDSIYKKYNGRLPDPLTKGRLKYRSNCYKLGQDYNSSELYGFKDFILSIGGFNIEFSYPQYSYHLKSSDLIGDGINLLNIKNREQIELEWVTIQVKNGEKRKFTGDNNYEELLIYLKEINKSKLLEIEISPIQYPNNYDIKCGKAIHHFPITIIQIN